MSWRVCRATERSDSNLTRPPSGLRRSTIPRDRGRDHRMRIGQRLRDGHKVIETEGLRVVPLPILVFVRPRNGNAVHDAFVRRIRPDRGANLAVTNLVNWTIV